MNDRVIEIGVGVVEQLTPHIIITARCYQGPIKLGDVFTHAYRLHSSWNGDGTYGPGIREDIRPVSFQIIAIWAYGHNFDELYPGTTCRLTLVGQDGRTLHADDVLGVVDTDEAAATDLTESYERIISF